MFPLLSLFPVENCHAPCGCPAGFSFTPSRMARSMLDRPGWPPDTLQLPFSAAACPRRCPGCFVPIQQRYHYHPGFQTICHRWSTQECRSYFSFFYYDSLFYPPAFQQAALCRQIFLRAAYGSPSSRGCPGFFVSFKIFSMFEVYHSLKISPY